METEFISIENSSSSTAANAAQKRGRPRRQIPFYYPQQIYNRLSETVIGQKQAKRDLAVLLYQHQIRFKCWSARQAVPPKINALLLGPSGCGKTILTQCLAKIIPFPVVSLNATQLVGRGYKGPILAGAK